MRRCVITALLFVRRHGTCTNEKVTRFSHVLTLNGKLKVFLTYVHIEQGQACH